MVIRQIDILKEICNQVIETFTQKGDLLIHVVVVNLSKPFLLHNIR